jgi:hypothetical protein
MSDHLTTDPNDPRLTHGTDSQPVPQAAAYLVLSEEERAKGFVRPYRDAYRHVGIHPRYTTRPLTYEERVQHGDRYVSYEPYPPEEGPVIGRFWTEAQLTSGCNQVTTMGMALSETYARDPKFYGATYCVHCKMHRPVAEFVWTADGELVGS